MVTDRGGNYDSHTLSGIRQQKCMAHVIRSIGEVVQTKVGRGRSFGKRLRREVSRHLRDRQMPDSDNQRLLNELGRHNDRGNLLRFLDDPRVEPTNNRAERALRGAVIARKVSHCSKTDEGAFAYSAFTSVIRTLAWKVDDETLVDALCDVFGGAPLQARSL